MACHACCHKSARDLESIHFSELDGDYYCYYYCYYYYYYYYYYRYYYYRYYYYPYYCW